MGNTPNDRDKKRKSTAASSSGSHSRRQSSERSSAQRRQQEAAARRNSILIIILSVVVLVAIVAGIIVNLGKKESDKKPASDSTAGSNVSIDVNDNALEENKYPAVNELIANYRKAFKDGDTELLKEVYNSDQEINVDILTATSQIILDYQNTQYYTKRGLNSGEYVVYVYDELKLANIETLAPNLSIFYVKPADDGSLYIYRGEYNAATGSFAYDEATKNYIDNLYMDQDVSNLISTVNTKMDSACANDADLMEFMQKVRQKVNVTSTPASDESETDTTESDSESETESGTGSEA
ncbi:MAG: hypothetical protein ACI4BB_08705 [Coprococcus sp.]